MLWSLVRADVMRRLADIAPNIPYEERVLIAEHAAREVQELLDARIATGSNIQESE